jgi:hypothetical protein
MHACVHASVCACMHVRTCSWIGMETQAFRHGLDEDRGQAGKKPGVSESI